MQIRIHVIVKNAQDDDEHDTLGVRSSLVEQDVRRGTLAVGRCSNVKRAQPFQDIGMKVLDKVRTDLDAVAKVESHPRLEGRQMVMVVAPK